MRPIWWRIIPLALVAVGSTVGAVIAFRSDAPPAKPPSPTPSSISIETTITPPPSATPVVTAVPSATPAPTRTAPRRPTPTERPRDDDPPEFLDLPGGGSFEDPCERNGC